MLKKILIIIKRYLKSPRKLIYTLGAKNVFNWLPDKLYLKMVYWCEMGKRLNLDNPKTFNEKLQWLKLNDRKPEHTSYVDKYEVRSYISEKIGGEYLIPLLGAYNSVDEIDLNKLPKQFVLKCTHGSHCNIICTNRDELDIEEAKKQLRKWMKKSWFWFGREWPYKNITPRIICEVFISDNDEPPMDYKVMCYSGVPRILQIHKKSSHRHTIDFYDIEGKLLPLRKKGFCNSDQVKIDIKNYKKMFELAKTLSQNTTYVRTDFYLIGTQIYFGELTFFDSCGFIDFEPDESNIFLGNMIRLRG